MSCILIIIGADHNLLIILNINKMFLLKEIVELTAATEVESNKLNLSEVEKNSWEKIIAGANVGEDYTKETVRPSLTKSRCKVL